MADSRPIDSADFQSQVERLRARGCRCMLRWRDGNAVPATICERAEREDEQHQCAVGEVDA